MSSNRIVVEEHPLLDVAGFVAYFPRPLSEVPTPPEAAALIAGQGAVPDRDPVLRTAVRDMLRHGGYKPSGRGKPASEYLARALAEGTLAPINAAVDVCNAVSLVSGLPISVLDLDRATGPFRIALAETGTTYVFNAAGQEISLGGLVCLFDREGPCANAVRDSQRTKTGAETKRTLSIIWGSKRFGDLLRRAESEYRRLLESIGADVVPIDTSRAGDRAEREEA